MNNERILQLDAIRGLALMFILLFHSSIYNFSNIHKLDFSHPPVLIVVMSFMALWGGVFIIYSMVANTLMFLRRSESNPAGKLAGYLVLGGLVYLALHYVLNIFLGRWNIDFVNNQPHYTFVAGSLRNLQPVMPPVSKLFEGSSLSTIAWNMIIVSCLLWLMFRNGRAGKLARNSVILAGGGSLILLLSFLRVGFFPAYTGAMESGNHFLSGVYSFLLANPYPLLPYLSYGFFGALWGLYLHLGRYDLMKKVLVPLGALFFIYGVSGMMNFDKTISKPDYFWYFKTCFELGTFLLLGVLIINGLKNSQLFLRKIGLVRWFGRISLTIYLAETATSELLRMAVTPIIPGWHETINGCLLFGGFNVLFWCLVVWLWKRAGFRYSLEYFWVKGFRLAGRESGRIEPPF